MNVRLNRSWQRQGYDVWVYERDPFRVWKPSADPGNFRGGEWAVFDEAEEPDASLFLPDGLLEALLAEAEKVIPASHATERHLTDTITVRDRLLNLVEEGWGT